MKFLDDVICPISFVKIDNHISRLTVFFNAVLLALYIWTGIPLFVFVVALDYGIRAVWNPQFSALRWVAAKAIGVSGMAPKLIDQAPKLFASRVGFLFAITSALLAPVSPSASAIVAAVLLVFTVLDSVFDFCVGCMTYYYVVLPFYQWRGIR